MNFQPLNKANDISNNVSTSEALIRFGITVFLPMAMLLIDKHLIIYAAPVSVYLLVTSIIRFCVFKYVWQHHITHSVS